jgi:lipopolysaccharide export system protein LptA
MKPTLILCALLGAGLLPSAWAEKADRNKPMQIESDSMRYEDALQITVFSGKVVATKGTLILRGARLEVLQDPEGYQYGLLTAAPGQKAFYRQKREGLDEWMEGEGERIEYDSRADRVTLINRAGLRRYRGTVLNDDITGQRIVYENLTDQFTVDSKSGAGKPGAESSGRVRAVLTPRKKEEAGK